ncbi:MAG TPA: choice-of-anchor K domain-containing protein [Opitutus sp.]|nr:choice-of-anchor K domain-containing protein [Opitutus sp.]
MRIRSIIATASGLALAVSLAHAQLMLSGHTKGAFEDLGEANTSVTNAPDGSSAHFATGIPATGSTQSMIDFTNTDFSNVVSGDPIQVGLFTIHNGRTLIGSGAPEAKFDLGLYLTSPAVGDLSVTTLNFSIDHTVNTGAGVPDVFSVTWNSPAPVTIDNYLVQFHVHFDPADFQVPEDSSVQRGDVYVTFTPIPETSAFAIGGAFLLLGLVGYRRFRHHRNGPGLPAAA